MWEWDFEYYTSALSQKMRWSISSFPPAHCAKMELRGACILKRQMTTPTRCHSWEIFFKVIQKFSYDLMGNTYRSPIHNTKKNCIINSHFIYIYIYSAYRYYRRKWQFFFLIFVTRKRLFCAFYIWAFLSKNSVCLSKVNMHTLIT